MEGKRIVSKRSAGRSVNRRSADRLIVNRFAEVIVTQGSTSTTPAEDIVTETGSPTNQMEENITSASEDSNASTPPIEDIITEDGILCSILSNLTLREAAQTCVLSPRWRHIWTCVPDLNFGAKDMFDDHTKHLLYDADTPLPKNEIAELMQRKTDQFIHYVDSVLQQRQLQGRSRLHKFVVLYRLHKIHSSYLDAWLSFAVSSKIKVLALCLQKPIYFEYPEEKYVFPSHLLGSSPSLEALKLGYCSLKPPCRFNGLRNLKKLELYSLDVTEQDISLLLSNCYTLEFIRLCALSQLVTLTIPHPLSQLQTFEAHSCELRGCVKINAENLTNLVYCGYPLTFDFRQSSRLLAADVTFHTEAREPNLNFYLDKLSSNLPQLQKLSCTIIGYSQVLVSPEGSNRFIHLRHLDWRWRHDVTKMSLHHLALILDASPYLEVLNLDPSRATSTIEKPPKRLDKLRGTLPRRSRTHLKTVQFKCFYWDRCHVEFVLYLLENAIELQWVKIMNRLNASTTKKLRQQLPANVKLQILAHP